MERIVGIVAPHNPLDFVIKLCAFILLCGVLNHIRDVVTYGSTGASSYFNNLVDATWTALPMCTLALLLIRHLNTLQERLYLQATTDPMTQIPNRRWFFDHCGSTITAGSGFVLLDVDHFKSVNDAYGHDVGDTCLKTVVAHMTNALPNGVKCARLGGEEFGILFPIADQKMMDAVQQICLGTKIVTSDNQALHVTLSAGIFIVEQDIEVCRAFRLADAALYRAKAAGRAQFALAQQTDTRQTVQRADEMLRASA